MSYRQGYRPPSSGRTSATAASSRSRSATRSQAASSTTRSQASSRASGNATRQKAATRNAPVSRGRAPKRKKRGRPIKIFLSLVLLALVATAGVMGYMMVEEVRRVERLDTFYPGVYVDDVPLYGATPQEAYDFLVARAKEGIDGWAITLNYGGQSWVINTDTLGMRGAVESTVQDEVNKAFMIGRTGENLWERYQTVSALKTEPYKGYTRDVEKNTQDIDSIIAEIAAVVYEPAVNAERSFDAERNNPVLVQNEVYGKELDAEGLKAQVLEMISTMTPGTIEVQSRMTEPPIKASTIAEEVTLIGYYSTDIAARSTEGRTANIVRGCEAFNGMKVEPGNRVSFNKTTGLRTEKNGFHEAEEIVSGSYETGVGGGICQVSSTLYNAVIKAGLKVRDRTNHGIPVNYMENGADATVADNRIDFVFENNTDEAIYIVSRVEGKKGNQKCVFEIYGRPNPNGYTYSLRHETIEEIPIPEPVYETDKTGEHVTYRDEQYQLTKGAVGYKVRTYLVTRDSSGAVIDDKELYTDTYKAQAPKVLVGANKRPES